MMNAGAVLFIVSLLILVCLLTRVLPGMRPQSLLIRRMKEAGIRPGGPNS